MKDDRLVLREIKSTVKTLDRIVVALEKIAKSQEVYRIYYDNIGYDEVVCDCGHEMNAIKDKWMNHCPMCGIKFEWRYNDDE